MATHRKPARKKPARKKPAPRKPAPRKPAPRKPAPRKPAPRKPAPRKSAPRKPAPRKSAPRKPAQRRKPARKKPPVRVTPLPLEVESDGKIRLNRFLASAGVCSRRAADDLIRTGRITVNGDIVSELGTRLDPAQDEVCFDEVRVRPEHKVYLLFNKPRGVV
ncbi:MAG: S4 domain-containing protein, partial [Planctomycetota bacterium]